MLQLLPFQASVLHGNAGILAFAAPVAIEQIEADRDAEVQTEVAAAAVGRDVILVEGVAVSAVHLHVWVVARADFLVVQTGQGIVLFGT